ncbi:hypothetical protein [Yoonia litorea]|uniref:Uncharacterized protein n=1 Tax=Yoonia litorea TaxID=1123755 RepID=A0A1I6MC69_9RHOB|nr:hypothetical protein [Yoonia litorea]SFS13178.1 hypothetical protein SAMN05444714_1503 [Yoonia litorea]
MRSKLLRAFADFKYKRALARVALPDTSPMPDLKAVLPADWAELPPQTRRAFTYDFRREMGPAHPLSRLKTSGVVVATAKASDDVLLWDSAQKDIFYLVHLTWSGKPDYRGEIYPLWSEVVFDAIAQRLAD